jgi:thiol-disulfide isomerase/thioredoxin
MERVSFLLGAASVAVLLPQPARADVAPFDSAEKPVASPQPHVHGPNGVVRLPLDRPLDWTLQVLDGPDFHLAAYRGKVVFLNVFATWCPPCRKEQPDLVAFAAAHPDDTVVIGIDVGETDDTVRRYRKKFGITYPIAMDRRDASVRSIFVQQRLLFPTTLVVRADGTLSCASVDDRDRAWFEAERLAALA